MIIRTLFAILLVSATLFFDSGLGFNGFVPIGVALACFLVVMLALERFRVADILSVMIMLALSATTLTLTFSYWQSDSAQYKIYIYIVLGFLTYLMTKSLVYELKAEQVARIINGVLLFHIGVLLLQLGLYRIFHYDLNVGALLGGLGHRAFTETGMYRPTGVFDEPAIYAMFTSSLLVCRMFYRRQLDWIFWLALICMALTMSMVALILAAGIFFAYSSARIKLWCVVAGVICAALLFSPLMENTYLGARIANVFVGADASTNSKVLVVSDWLNTPQLLYFGFGYIGLRDWTPSYYDAMFDLSFYLTVLVEFGIFIGAVVLFWFFSAVVLARRPAADKLALLVVLLKLTALHFPMLWILFALFFAKSRDQQTAQTVAVQNTMMVTPASVYKSST